MISLCLVVLKEEIIGHYYWMWCNVPIRPQWRSHCLSLLGLPLPDLAGVCRIPSRSFISMQNRPPDNNLFPLASNAPLYGDYPAYFRPIPSQELIKSFLLLILMLFLYSERDFYKLSLESEDKISTACWEISSWGKLTRFLIMFYFLKITSSWNLNIPKPPS